MPEQRFLPGSYAVPRRDNALLVGRLWQPGVGPIVVAYQAGALHDLSRLAPTTSQLIDLDDPAAATRAALAGAPRIPEFAAVLANSDETSRKSDQAWLLAPNGLQVVKGACGATFVESLLERVIEEQARGDASKAEVIRQALSASGATTWQASCRVRPKLRASSGC